MVTPVEAARRALPSVDRLLTSNAVAPLIAKFGRALTTDTIRSRLQVERETLAQRESGARGFEFDEARFVAACDADLTRQTEPSLRPVFNLTGTVLHTNLGRALMPQAVADAVMVAMTRPVNLEFDLGGGARGERDTHVEKWITRLAGGDGAVVVNNNAAAVYLVLNTLGAKKEVLVSRGELIEIGGAFRIPDIMKRAGVKLVEVGATNRTHLKDFADAITPRTAAIMKVHTSNYAIQGFTSAVPEADLAKLAHEHGIPYIVDLGSGMLVNLEDYGLPHEPTPREALANGADLVTFSGDKLLGGPQAGLMVGKKDLIARIRKNPMKRALRVDKITLAALDALLRLYTHPEKLREQVTTIRLLTRTRDDIRAQAERVLPQVQAALSEHAQASVVECGSQIGSGSLPVDSLPSAGIAITQTGKRKGSFADKLSLAFRALPVPVIGHIRDGAFILDLRCLDNTYEAEFLQQLPQLRLS